MSMTMPPSFLQSLALHGLILGALIFPPKNASKKQVPTKVTWINLAASGLSGGVEANELGKNPQRIRLKQQVAARNEEKSIAATPPDRLGIKSKGLIAKGTNLDERSIGVAPSAPKSTDPSEAKIQGAVGKGNSGGIGNGTPMPGLRASSGISGGQGVLSATDTEFPYTYYLQQVQNKITANWSKSGGQGRVAVYFRIKKDGSIDFDRLQVESPSGNRFFDESARLAIMRSGSFPPLPQGYLADTLGIHFWFIAVN
jgi:TonB family protein